ncbi:unnamed protein product [Strongylus vulgaris]|uniref:Uncharacterized protein n=1 Tax=Strongylus vulgaris TaxID=40348 RepID=A0A3P7KBH9_STRVU|nr:unnamed protein product [Strongylus vulgaris]
MPRMSCAHKMSANKRLERVDSLMAFLKTATYQHMSARLHDIWAAPQSTITEARLLLTLGMIDRYAFIPTVLLQQK